jgi:transcriptional regulator with XRE-family HTH domain
MMYNPADVAENIKTIAKRKGISMKQVLDDCGLNKNVLSTMLSRGSMPKADNIAIIADYLDCSVDYLLGRTDNPESHKIPVESIGAAFVAALAAESTETEATG